MENKIIHPEGWKATKGYLMEFCPIMDNYLLEDK